MNIEIKEYDNERYREGLEDLADHYKEILTLLGEDPARPWRHPDCGTAP